MSRSPAPFVLEDSDGLEHHLPTKREICHRCDGTGSHINPSIDGHGISSEEWERDWDDDDREGYFNGRYDVTCEECKGEKVINVPDEARMTPEQVAMLHEHYRSESECRAMEEAERRMGA